MSEYMQMIDDGNGWYAMQLGLGVVFTSLFLVSTLLSLAGLFFRKREVWKRRRAAGMNGFKAVADAISSPPAPIRTVDDPDEEEGDGVQEEVEQVAAAVAVALSLARGVGFMAGAESGSDSWKLSGRLRLHTRGSDLVSMREAGRHPSHAGGAIVARARRVA